MSATLRPGLELLDDAVERRQPRRDQARVVAGAEEALAALEHVVVVLVPADTRRRYAPPRVIRGESITVPSAI